MTSAAKQQSKTGATKARGQDTGYTAEASETPASQFGGVEARVRPAYRAYLEAQRDLANAFRGRERQDQEAYKDAERRYQACQEAVERAMKAREKAERYALDIYTDTVDKAVKKASDDYRETMKLALRECEQTIQLAWRTSWMISAEMTAVFHGNDGHTDEKEQFREGSPSREPQRSRLREKILRWKTRCTTVIRQALRPRGQSAGQ